MAAAGPSSAFHALEPSWVAGSSCTSPSKAAVLSITQPMVIALLPHCIRGNAILPGTVHTQLAEPDMQIEMKRKQLEQ